MLVQIPRHGAIKGCTVYAAPNGVASKTPACIDASVTLPQLSFPTNTIQAMGGFDIPAKNSLTAMVGCTVTSFNSAKSALISLTKDASTTAPSIRMHPMPITRRILQPTSSLTVQSRKVMC